jgi:RHS repeat-associated protein
MRLWGKLLELEEIAFVLAAQPLIASRKNAHRYDESASGAYQDNETNLHYNVARDYDPVIGRYIQSDPIGLAGGENLFLYASADSIRNTDPLGLDCETLGSFTIPGFLRKVDSKEIYRGLWKLYMVVVSPTASRMLLGRPGGRVDCYAKRNIYERNTYERRGIQISWGYCSDCAGVRFWTRSEDVLLERFSKLETRPEEKGLTQPIYEPYGPLGASVCKTWLDTLNNN